MDDDNLARSLFHVREVIVLLHIQKLSETMSVVIQISTVHMWYRVHVEGTHIFTEEKYNSTFTKISLARKKK
jgi:hypothetical protein